MPVQREVDEELALHIELRTRDYVARGMTPTEARAAALHRFGDVALVEQECLHIGRARERDMRRAEWWAELRQDLAYAWRQLGRSRGFTAAAVLTLALGIGATTAIFTVVDAVVLRPLPFDEPSRVVRFRATSANAGWEKGNFAPGEYGGWQREGRSWERLALVYPGDFTLAGDELPERVVGERVTRDYFAVFGVRPALGRVFGADEDRPGGPRVVVLSDRLWRRSFGASPAVLGRTVELNADRYQVVGVMPPAFDFAAQAPELWVPAAFGDDALRNLGGRFVEVVGRLRPGVAPATAEAEALVIARRLWATRASSREDAAGTVRVRRYADDLTSDVRLQLLVMLGAVGLVLLIACVNVANLLAARGLARGRELAIRAALGAGRGRIVRQLVAECALLAGLGAAAALALAAGGAWLLVRLVPPGVPRVEQAAVDGRVLLFTLGLTLLTTLLLSLTPARQTDGGDLLGALRRGGRAANAQVRHRARTALAAGEVALALVLLVLAGLLIRSALVLRRVPAGVDGAQVLTARLRLPAARYREPARVTAAFERIAEAAAAVPGVRSAALVSRVPLTGMNTGVDFVRVGDAAAVERGAAVASNFRIVSPAYFRTMGIPVRWGRDFTAADRAGAPRAVVVNEALARALSLGARPQGARLWSTNGAFWFGADRPADLVVVGVVGDIRDDGLREAVRPEAYFPLAQAPEEPWSWIERSMLVVARTGGPPALAAPALQRAVRAVDPSLPMYDVRTMDARLADATAVDRFYTGLLAALGGAALLLAAVGIYGVVAHLTRLQVREMGVRLALGATGAGVVRLMLARHLRPVAAGLALGTAGALLAARALEARLYGVPPTDPATLAGAAALLTVVAAVACWLPARRAARVDPTVALRAD
ncbi:MAG: Acidobacterial duplicated orphan permease (function unknown) [uncultured Gemmatimonadaceae bacterium]|uniref:Permease n=1 Tax=uncultured Gemmatimonadaceae bacterium TaxID=246130 RepID=A0A6J4KD97_9BACT|nr:MAG: Acidobacterial duplicated orphan permease (function unknown) [uncultured Gemmatimonadaceae bacterium]